MKTKKILMILSLAMPLLAGCSGNKEPEYDPFTIGDNLEVISRDEAKLVANEAYNNLSYTTSLRIDYTDILDDTYFYTGAFSSYATSRQTSKYSEILYYSNAVDETTTTDTLINFGDNTATGNQSEKKISWYGIKPAREGEPQDTDYSVLYSITKNNNGASYTRYGTEEGYERFSTVANIGPLWNQYLVKTIENASAPKDEHDDPIVSISYSPNNTYVKDDQHIIGYYSSTKVEVEPSKITPSKEETSYVKQTKRLDVIDFYKDEVLGIGWTVRNISTRILTSYLTTAEGKASENPIDIAKTESVSMLEYDATHTAYENIPTYQIENTIKLSIAQFDVTGGTSTYTGVSIELDSNDDYYRLTDKTYNGHAYYKDVTLEVGYYSLYDGTPTDPTDYKKWGFNKIKVNKCPNNIVQYREGDSPLDVGGLFYVRTKAKFSFRVVLNAEMTTFTDYTVAVIG